MRLRKIHNFPLLAVLLLSLFPLLIKSLTSWRTEAAALLAVTYALPCVFNFKKLSQAAQRLVVMLLVFDVMVAAYVGFGISEVHYDFVAGEIIWSLVCIIAVYTDLLFDRRGKKLLLFFSVAIILFSVLYLTRAGLSAVSRSLKEGEHLSSAQYSSMIMLFAGLYIMVFLKDRRILHRLLGAAVYIMSFVVIAVVLQRGINTTFLVLLLAAMLFYNKKRSVNRTMAGTVVIALAVIFVYSGMLESAMLNWTGLFSERLSERLVSIIEVFRTGEVDKFEVSFIHRIRLIISSLDTWTGSLLSLLVGIGEREGFDTYVISNHSDIVDTLGKYGLLGAVIMYNILVNYYRWIIEKTAPYLAKGSTTLTLVICLFSAFILRGLLGVVFIPEIAVVISIILPLMVQLVINERGHTE